MPESSPSPSSSGKRRASEAQFTDTDSSSSSSSASPSLAISERKKVKSDSSGERSSSAWNLSGFFAWEKPTNHEENGMNSGRNASSSTAEALVSFQGNTLKLKSSAFGAYFKQTRGASLTLEEQMTHLKDVQEIIQNLEQATELIIDGEEDQGEGLCIILSLMQKGCAAIRKLTLQNVEATDLRALDGVISLEQVNYLACTHFSVAPDIAKQLLALFPSVISLSLNKLNGKEGCSDGFLSAMEGHPCLEKLNDLRLNNMHLKEVASLKDRFTQMRNLESLHLLSRFGFSDAQVSDLLNFNSEIRYMVVGFPGIECLAQSIERRHQELDSITVTTPEVSGVSCWRLVLQVTRLSYVEVSCGGSDQSRLYNPLHLSSRAQMTAETFFQIEAINGSNEHEGGAVCGDYVDDSVSLATIMSLFPTHEKSVTEAPRSGIGVSSWLHKVSKTSSLANEAKQLERILKDDYRVCPTEKDGNCLLSAIEMQIPSCDKVEGGLSSQVYRDLICYELLRDPERYARLLPTYDKEDDAQETVENYVAIIQLSGEWGGEIEAFLMANVLKRPIGIVLCHPNKGGEMTCKLQIYRPDQSTVSSNDEGSLLLVHYDGTGHYQGILPENGAVNHRAVSQKLLKTFSSNQSTEVAAPETSLTATADAP